MSGSYSVNVHLTNLHAPVAEILEETEGCHFYSRLENEDGREEKVEYFQRKF